MNTLYVLYDGNCAFCLRCRHWLAEQTKFIPLEFIPAQAAEIGRRFPGIEAFDIRGRLTVVSDEGAVYQGPNAFIICLYALREYREWSLRLARPTLLPFAQTIFEMLSRRRYDLSRWLGKRDDQQLAEVARLNTVPEAAEGACQWTPGAGAK